MSFSSRLHAAIRPVIRSSRSVPSVPTARVRSVPPLATASRPLASSSTTRPFSSTPSIPREAVLPQTADGRTAIGRIERRLRIVFTCTAPVPVDPEVSAPGSPARACGKRSSHEFSKRSYEKGIVIVQCPECSNRHLIADHLQWFSQTPSPQHPTGQPIGSETPRTIEDLMREKGEQVRWIDEGDEGATLEVEGPEEGSEEVKK
ncbi:hypothetical protein JCM10212_001685 [Sporobolomyces blumeae]